MNGQRTRTTYTGHPKHCPQCGSWASPWNGVCRNPNCSQHGCQVAQPAQRATVRWISGRRRPGWNALAQAVPLTARELEETFITARDWVIGQLDTLPDDERARWEADTRHLSDLMRELGVPKRRLPVRGDALPRVSNLFAFSDVLYRVQAAQEAQGAETLDSPIGDVQAAALDWQRVLDVEPLVLSAARYWAGRTGVNADELAAIMRCGIVEAAEADGETFLSRPDSQVVRRGVWYALNRLRKHRRIVPVEDDTLERLAITEGIDETAVAVRQVVSDLQGDLQRIALALLRGHGLKVNGTVNVSELSRELGIPVTTVRRRIAELQRALAPLVA